MRTWQIKTLIVGLVLGTVAIVSGGPVEYVGAAAVLLSFGHAQVSDRLQSSEARRPTPSVECHTWSNRYLLGKEALWLVYFVMLSAWSALVGVGLFLAYPFWRKHYNKRRHR